MAVVTVVLRCICGHGDTLRTDLTGELRRRVVRQIEAEPCRECRRRRERSGAAGFKGLERRADDRV